METKLLLGPNYFTHLYEGFTRFLAHYLQLPNNKLTSLRLFDAFFFVSDVADSREELLVGATRLLAATSVRQDEVQD